MFVLILWLVTKKNLQAHHSCSQNWFNQCFNQIQALGLFSFKQTCDPIPWFLQNSGHKSTARSARVVHVAPVETKQRVEQLKHINSIQENHNVVLFRIEQVLEPCFHLKSQNHLISRIFIEIMNVSLSSSIRWLGNSVRSSNWLAPHFIGNIFREDGSRWHAPFIAPSIHHWVVNQIGIFTSMDISTISSSVDRI